MKNHNGDVTQNDSTRLTAGVNIATKSNVTRIMREISKFSKK